MTDAALLRDLLLSAGERLRDLFRADLPVEMKGRRDPVTAADRAVERMIVERLARERPDDSVVTEEELSAERGDGERRWVIDPLDGTNNFAHGIPHFCVSIALLDRAGALAGGVYDPMRDELFLAARGEGAARDGAPIRVAATASLRDALLATGFAYDRNETAENNVAPFSRLILEINDIRRMGSAALDLCYVACGRYDGFWEYHLKPWDTAAGALLVAEAGGRVTDGCGNPHRPGDPLVVATNGAIHGELLNQLNIV